MILKASPCHCYHITDKQVFFSTLHAIANVRTTESKVLVTSCVKNTELLYIILQFFEAGEAQSTTVKPSLPHC